jgi:hypothetical protein
MSEKPETAAVIQRLERERDEARGECNEAQDGWSRALDERNDARKELDDFIQLIRGSIARHYKTGKYIDALIAQSLENLLITRSLLKFAKMKSKLINESGVNQ